MCAQQHRYKQKINKQKCNKYDMTYREDDMSPNITIASF